jgi:hypothetical protein
MFTLKHMKPINSFCVQNADLLIAKAAGTYSYHWSLINELRARYQVSHKYKTTGRRASYMISRY